MNSRPIQPHPNPAVSHYLHARILYLNDRLQLLKDSLSRRFPFHIDKRRITAQIEDTNQALKQAMAQLESNPTGSTMRPDSVSKCYKKP